MSMSLYQRKIGEPVNAVQFILPWDHADGEYGVCSGVTCDCRRQSNRTNGRWHVHTIHEGQAVLLQDGDWILPEPDGIHFYPVKPEIFDATYEAVGNARMLIEVVDAAAFRLCRWISLNERLPEIGGEYIVAYESNDGEQPLILETIAEYCTKSHGIKVLYEAGKWYWTGENALEFEDVIAWMEIPRYQTAQPENQMPEACPIHCGHSDSEHRVFDAGVRGEQIETHGSSHYEELWRIGKSIHDLNHGRLDGQ